MCEIENLNERFSPGYLCEIAPGFSRGAKVEKELRKNQTGGKKREKRGRNEFRPTGCEEDEMNFALPPGT